MSSLERRSTSLLPVHHNHGVKRSYEQMEGSHRHQRRRSLQVSSSNQSSSPASPPISHNQHDEVSRQDSRHSPNPGYRREAYDYRRPVMSNSTPHNVIDLTDSDNTMNAASRSQSTEASAAAVPPPQAQRLPRYDREIIDLSADMSPELNRGPRISESGRRLPENHMANTRRASSPEVTFVSQRPRSRPPSRRDPPSHGWDFRGIFEDQVTDLTGEEERASDEDDDDDDEVRYVRTTDRPEGINTRAPFAVGNVAARPLARSEFFPMPVGLPSSALQNIAGHLSRGSDLMARGSDLMARQLHRYMQFDHTQPRRAPPGHLPPPRPGFEMPGMLDYASTGFDIGVPESRPEPPPVRYEPPTAAATGFTRTPHDKKDEAVVCPCCGDELAVGDSDEKRQVWAVKACGHVYCGSCMINRANKKVAKMKEASGKGKGKAKEPVEQATVKHKPFSSCLVEGCTSKVSHRANVVQVFL